MRAGRHAKHAAFELLQHCDIIVTGAIFEMQSINRNIFDPAH